jgi:alanine racemase
MNMRTLPRVWVDIDLNTLRDNYISIAGTVAPAQVLAVLKADAYGLGCLPIARALASAGVACFGVAEPNEAFRLAEVGLPVQILGAVLPDEIPELVGRRIVLPLTDLASARRIAQEALRQGIVARGHLKIDSGMGRLGIPMDGAIETIRAIRQLPGLSCEGIYTHFPSAYRGGDDLTLRQIAGMVKLIHQLELEGITFACRHVANSDAINNYPQTAHPPFNWVRTGINLHGSFDTEGDRRLHLRSILTLKTRLMSNRLLPEGSTIGYGSTCRLPRAMPVGTISAGYADGLPLALSNRGHVLIHGCACPIIGRLSMDYTTVSLEHVPGAAPGDEVICLGGDGAQAITVESWARLKGTHPYEIICSFGNRVKRCYTGA